jgi:hypothetical protein
VTVKDTNNLRFSAKEIPMSVRTCFIGTQSLHTEDISIGPMSRKRELGAALVIALTLGTQLIAPRKSTAQVNGIFRVQIRRPTKLKSRRLAAG